jgi:hypothetical protein
MGRQRQFKDNTLGRPQQAAGCETRPRVPSRDVFKGVASPQGRREPLAAFSADTATRRGNGLMLGRMH